MSDIIQELQAALRASGSPWQVVVTADGHQINFHPIDPWQQLVAQCDDMAAGCDGWMLSAGRAIFDKQGMLAYGCTAPAECHLYGIVIEDFDEKGRRGKQERHVDLGRIA